MPTASIVTFIAGSLLTLYLGILELLKKDKSWAKISVLLTLFCVFLGAGLYDILEKDDKEEVNKKEIITQTNDGVEKIKNKIDTSEKNISNKIDSQTGKVIVVSPPPNKKESAILVPCPVNYANPVLSQMSDSFVFKLCVANIGKGIAFKITDISASVGFKNDEIFYYSVLQTPLFNNRIIMPSNSAQTLSASLLKKGVNFNDMRYFFCIKLIYGDSISLHNEWVGIFETTGLPTNVVLTTPNTAYFYKIEKYLKAKKIW